MFSPQEADAVSTRNRVDRVADHEALLRDVVAGLIVERARRLNQLAAPG